MMKKLTAVFLALLLVCGAVSALADTTTLQVRNSKGNVIGWEEYDEQGTLVESHVYDSDGFTEKYYENGKLQLRLEGNDFAEDAGIRKAYDGKGNLLGYESWDWSSSDHWTGASYDAKGNVTSMYYGDNNGSVVFDGKGNVVDGWVNGLSYDPESGKWLDENGAEGAAPDVSAYREGAEKALKDKKAAKVIEPTWYPNNTAGVIGISLRDAYPGLTDKWYHVLPVDLSQDGTQTFDLIASARYYLGKVAVTVNGDEVTTEYAYISSPMTFQIYPQESECLAWFTGVEEITTDFLANPTGNAQFGTAISKENDLKGQDKALLFICNRVTYRTPLNAHGAMPREYWQNSTNMADYFAGKKALMEQVEAAYAERIAAEEAAAEEEPETPAAANP